MTGHCEEGQEHAADPQTGQFFLKFLSLSLSLLDTGSSSSPKTMAHSSRTIPNNAPPLGLRIIPFVPGLNSHSSDSSHFVVRQNLTFDKNYLMEIGLLIEMISVAWLVCTYDEFRKR